MATNQDDIFQAACWPVCMLLGKSRQDCLARSAENLEDVDGGIAGEGPILQHKLPSLPLGLFLGGSGLAVNSVGKWQQLRPKRRRAGEAAQCQRHLYKLRLSFCLLLLAQRLPCPVNPSSSGQPRQATIQTDRMRTWRLILLVSKTLLGIVRSNDHGLRSARVCIKTSQQD